LLIKRHQIELIIEPTIEALGFKLWGLEYRSQGRHTLLRVFIDSETGVSIDDCAQVSRQLGGIFDVEDPISGEYTLEVSSPGIDRLLFSLEQYVPYIGEWIEIRLRTPSEGRRKYSGTLKNIEGEDVVVQADEHEFLLPFSAIDKAQIKPRD